MNLLSVFTLYGYVVSILSLFNDTLTSFDVIITKWKGKSKWQTANSVQ